MFYVFDEFGEFFGEYPNVNQVCKAIGTTIYKFNQVIDKRDTEKGYYITTKKKLWLDFKPTEVYIFNERGVLVQVTGSYNTLYTRVKGKFSKETIRKFFFDDKMNELQHKEYRYYKVIPDHVPDLFKRYSLLDEEGNITNYYKDLASICKATGLSRQSVHYQTTKKDGFIRRNC